MFLQEQKKKIHVCVQQHTKKKFEWNEETKNHVAIICFAFVVSYNNTETNAF